MNFKLSITNLEGKKVINFANNSNDFVEVVFTIDGKEVKRGKDITSITKGYAYPPNLEKTVKKMEDGSLLPFSENGGEVVAYIFGGSGKYKDEDIEKPAFARHQLVSKVKFKRSSNEPIEILKVTY